MIARQGPVRPIGIYFSIMTAGLYIIPYVKHRLAFERYSDGKVTFPALLTFCFRSALRKAFSVGMGKYTAMRVVFIEANEQNMERPLEEWTHYHPQTTSSRSFRKNDRKAKPALAPQTDQSNHHGAGYLSILR